VEEQILINQLAYQNILYATDTNDARWIGMDLIGCIIYAMSDMVAGGFF